MQVNAHTGCVSPKALVKKCLEDLLAEEEKWPGKGSVGLMKQWGAKKVVAITPRLCIKTREGARFTGGGI